MALGGVYETGTVTIVADRVSVIGVGTLWSPIVEVGDWLFIGGQVGLIGAIVDDTHLTLETQWQGTLPATAIYVIVKMSWLRYDPALTQAKVRQLLEELDDQGNFLFTSTAPPDPAMGEDGQWALKTDVSPWQLWFKQDGVWVAQAPPAGIKWRGAWSAATAYAPADGVERLGSSYISKTSHTNQPPETNTDDWDLMAAKGATGTTGAPGPAGMVWRGNWSSSTAYAVNDGVAYLGASYICVTAHIATVTPPPTANWNVLAAASSAPIVDDQVTPPMLDADTLAKVQLFHTRLRERRIISPEMGGGQLILYVGTVPLSGATISVGTPAYVFYGAHGLPIGATVSFRGTPPAPIQNGVVYYVIAANYSANSFNISATPGGAAINTTAAGTGTLLMWTGNDTTGDGTTSNPFMTPQAAYLYAVSNIDLRGLYLIIKVRSPYVAASVCIQLSGFPPGLYGDTHLQIEGDPTTPANCILDGSFACIYASQFANAQVRGFRLQGNCGFNVNQHASIEYAAIDFGVCSFAHYTASKFGYLYDFSSSGGNCTISGGALAHAYIDDKSYVAETEGVTTFTTTVSFSIAYANVSQGAVFIQHSNKTWAGPTPTGKKFNAVNNGIVAGDTPTFLPGTLAGTLDQTSIYVSHDFAETVQFYPAWVAYTPVVTATGGAVASGTCTGRYKTDRYTRKRTVSLILPITANTIANWMNVTLPPGNPVGAGAGAGCWTLTGSGALAVQMNSVNTTMHVMKYDGSAPTGTGTMQITCDYEI